MSGLLSAQQQHVLELLAKAGDEGIPTTFETRPGYVSGRVVSSLEHLCLARCVGMKTNRQAYITLVGRHVLEGGEP